MTKGHIYTTLKGYAPLLILGVPPKISTLKMSSLRMSILKMSTPKMSITKILACYETMNKSCFINPIATCQSGPHTGHLINIKAVL